MTSDPIALLIMLVQSRRPTSGRHFTAHFARSNSTLFRPVTLVFLRDTVLHTREESSVRTLMMPAHIYEHTHVCVDLQEKLAFRT